MPPLSRSRQACGVRAFRELPNARRTPNTTQARRAATGRDRLLSAHSRAAATATTAPTPPPLAVRAGHGAASSQERRRQSPNGGSTWRGGGSGGADRGLLPSNPVNVLLSPLESIFQKSRFLPAPPSPSSLHNVTELPPRPGSRRSLPPRWAAAEESCPRRSGCGQRVLAAPCVRREWSCCKMAAEAHAAGSKPDPVPLASERAPGARARLRVTPPSLPSPPSRVRFSHSLPQPLPSSSSSFSFFHHHQPLSAFFTRPCFLPSLLFSPTAVRSRSSTSGRPSPPRSHARLLPPSLSQPRSPGPAE